MLDTLTIRDASNTVVEEHDVSYTDGDDVFVSGHRTRDVYRLVNPDGLGVCASSSCTATWAYDARDRLVNETNHGDSTTFELDLAGNVICRDGPTATVGFTHVGNQLETQTAGCPDDTHTVEFKYLYDADGNLDCVTTAAHSGSTCPTSGNTLVEAYSYDHLNRIDSFRRFAGGSLVDYSAYDYDALGRLVEQAVQHGGEMEPLQTTTFTHLGLSSLVTGETLDHEIDGITEKTYSYDTFGNRIGMTNQPDGEALERYTYGHDVHGSVSLLLDESAGVQASYGYTTYGSEDEELSDGDAAEPGLTNPFRYTGQRFDTGSGTLEMGHHRFGPDTSRFLQPDLYKGALADLSLTVDPLTQNRYALAGGNPISFVDMSGHAPIPNGGGGSSTSPKPREGGLFRQAETRFNSSSGSLLEAATAIPRGQLRGAVDWVVGTVRSAPQIHAFIDLYRLQQGGIEGLAAAKERESQATLNGLADFARRGNVPLWMVSLYGVYQEEGVVAAAEQFGYDASRTGLDAAVIALTAGAGAGAGANAGSRSTISAVSRGTRSRSFQFGDLPDGVLGSTDQLGNITIQGGLAGRVFEQTLRHETVHSVLTPPH